MSTPADPGEEARAWTHRALAQEWRYDGPDVRDHADVLVGAAEEADTPVEELIRWIHDPATVEYTLELWRDHLQRYTSLRARLKLNQRPLFEQTPAPADAFEPNPRKRRR